MFSNGKTNEIEKLTSTSKLSKSILDYEANEFLFFLWLLFKCLFRYPKIIEEYNLIEKPAHEKKISNVHKKYCT